MDNDWKTDALQKAGAMQEAQAAQLNDDDVEQAFADQAWMQVQNKVRPIAKEPYILGFEIVWKNDSNSKMIGIYAFRVNKKLFYSPVFFINGEIKGTDLFYNHDKKLFNPATNEWIEYFLAQEQNTQGEPVDRSAYNANPKQMNIADIESPPATGSGGRNGSFGSRRASTEAAAALPVDDFKAAFVGMQEAGTASEDSILKRFLQNEGLGAFDKLAHWIESDFEFAEQLLKNVPQENFMPESLNFKKQASTAPKTELQLHTGTFNENVPAELKAAHLKKGYTFEDVRPTTRMEHIYENPRNFESISEAGVWSVILRGGEQKEFIAAPYMPKSWLTDHDHGMSPHFEDFSENPFTSSNPDKRHRTVLLLDRSSKKYDTFSKEIFGEKGKSDITEIPEELIKNKPSKKKAYLMYDRVGKWVTGPFAIKKIYTFDGVTKIDMYNWCDDRCQTIKLNPDYDKNDYQALVFGTETMGWIEVAADISKSEYSDDTRVQYEDLDVRPGDEKDVTQAIDFHAGYKQAAVRCIGEDAYQMTYNGQISLELTRVGAIAVMMKEASVCEDEATAVVANADEQGHYSFFCKMASSNASKKLQFENLDQEFYQPSQNEFGVLEDELTQTQELSADTQDNTEAYQNETTWRHGDDNYDRGDDREDPTVVRNYDRMKVASMLEQLLQTGSADEIAQAAGESGQRNIFEHGVVGQLVNTYDAADMIQQYVPDLSQALDKIGRILFLLYWRPEDFTERYGADDQSELENMLMSTFKQYGDLVLELLKRNPDAETSLVSSN